MREAQPANDPAPAPLPPPTASAMPRPSAEAAPAEDGSDLDPRAIARLGSMVAQLIEEMHGAAIDDAGRDRLRDVHAHAMVEVRDRLPVDLRDELDRFALPLRSDGPVSTAELRIAEAQLVGWLRGLFAGAQFAATAAHPELAQPNPV